MHETRSGRVAYLEYFQDEDAMEQALRELALQSSASVLRTNRDIMGKRILKYLLEVKMPVGSVLRTCHKSQGCQIRPDLSVCDSRFEDQASYIATAQKALVKPSLRGSSQTQKATPRPLCHSPPTTSDMVYTLIEFEDAQTEWVMWACHRHNLKETICHVTDVVAVDNEALLRAVTAAV